MGEATVLLDLAERSHLRQRLSGVEDRLESEVQNRRVCFPGGATLDDIVVGNTLFAIGIEDSLMELLSICWINDRGVWCAGNGGNITVYSLASLGVMPDENGAWFRGSVSFPDNPESLRSAAVWLRATRRHKLVKELANYLHEKYALQINPVEGGGFAFVSTSNLTDPGDDLLL